MSSKSISSESPEILTGNLDKISLPNLLILFQNSKKTGALDLNSKYELTIFYDKGFPYFAAGGSGETLLGKILLNKNKITKYQYDKAAEEIEKDKNKRIGEILVSLGMITPHELNEFLELQLKEKILESFLYLEGSYEFKESGSIDNSIFYSKINTSELIHDGFQRFVKSTDIDFEIFDAEFISDLNDKTTDIGLGPKELRLVQLISQNKTLKDIEKSKKFKKDEILRVVFILGLYGYADIKNFSINNYLLEEFHKFRLMNPLPNQRETEYTAEEQSELTDPTADVLLLDDELEATAERERLEMKNKDDNNGDVPVEPADEKIEVEDLTSKSPESIIDREAEAQDVDGNTPPNTDAEKDDDEDEDLNIKEKFENFKFQDEYEGDQEGIDPKKSRKKQAEAKQEKEKVIEIDSGNAEEQAIPDKDAQKDLPETEVKTDDAGMGEGVPTADEPAADDSADQEVPDTSKNDEALQELNDFYEFITNEEDYYRLLKVQNKATDDEIKDSYYQLIKKFHPDANASFPEDIRVKAEQIFTKVTKAYEILQDPEKRYEYDGKDELNKIKDKANSIYEAELIYTEGEMLLRQRNYKEAEKKLFSAIEMNPDESAYKGMYAWARYLAAPDKERVLNEVKKELNKAIEMDPSVEQNYYYLGSIYKFSENFSRAEQNFSKAVSIDPNYIEAKRELRLIKNRKSQKGKLKESDKKIEKKFWSGLFKK